MLTRDRLGVASLPPEWLPAERHDGVIMRPFRLVTHIWQGEPILTFGLLGLPPGPGPHPGILHVHGGGQTASPEEVVAQVRRGYACLSFDWSGDRPGRPPERVTRYPANYPVYEVDWLRHLDRNGSPECRYLQGLRTAIRGLDLLQAEPTVDGARLGAYGISWGGFLMWLLNGIDDRLSAAAAIYGTGGLHWPGHLWNTAWAQVGEAARATWLRDLEPRAYAAAQHAPLCFLNGTNDFFGGLDVAAELLPMLPVAWRADYAPNSDHHLGAGGLALMRRWFDHHLRGTPPPPPSPSLRAVREAAGLRVTTDGDCATTALWYSLGNRPHQSRCWRVASDWQRDGESLTMTVDCPRDAWLFVRRHTDDGLSLSSAPLCVEMVPREVVASDILLAPGQRAGLGIWMGTQPGDAADAWDRFTIDGVGLRGAPGQPVTDLILRTPADPATLPPPATAGMRLTLSGCRSLRLTCTIRRGPPATERHYHADRVLAADGEQVLTYTDFRTETGEPLTSFAGTDKLTFHLQPREGEAIVLREVAWYSPIGPED